MPDRSDGLALWVICALLLLIFAALCAGLDKIAESVKTTRTPPVPSITKRKDSPVVDGPYAQWLKANDKKPSVRSYGEWLASE